MKILTDDEFAKLNRQEQLIYLRHAEDQAAAMAIECREMLRVFNEERRPGEPEFMLDIDDDGNHTIVPGKPK